jgi:hypothetical protein
MHTFICKMCTVFLPRKILSSKFIHTYLDPGVI